MSVSLSVTHITAIVRGNNGDKMQGLFNIDTACSTKLWLLYYNQLKNVDRVTKTIL